jgi:hypothetical protein
MRLVCVICTEIFVINSQISVVHCGHLFHEDCLSKWLNSGQKTCPQCRFTANSKSIVKKLYLTESDDTKSSNRLNSTADGPLSSTQISHENDELLNEIGMLREELKEKQTQLQLKSNVIGEVCFNYKGSIGFKPFFLLKKETKLKEIEAKNTSLKKESKDRLALIEFFKVELK